MATALKHDGGPFAIRYPKAGAGAFVPDAGPRDPARRIVGGPPPGARTLRSSRWGPWRARALKAAESLAAKGVDVEVVNCRFIKPLDGAYLASRMPAFPRILTVEEGVVQGGFGSAVLEWKAAAGVPGTVILMGLPDQYVPHGPRPKLLEDLGLTAEGIERTLMEGWLRPARVAAP